MRKNLLVALLFIFLCIPKWAYSALEDSPPPEASGSQEKTSGWFIGSDQGVLFFVGDSSQWVSPQYYSTLFGGYNIKGLVQPMLRIGQALGHLDGFFNPTTYFFMLDAGAKFTPIRTKFRPYFVGTAGFYVLDFSNFGSPIQGGLDFTYSAGGGLEAEFGRSVILLGSEFRGFRNDGPDLKGVSVTLGYTFQF